MKFTSVAPAPLRENFNRQVSTALGDFTEAQRAKAFELAIQGMAADPEIQAECREISRDLAHRELDGLPDDSAGKLPLHTATHTHAESRAYRAGGEVLKGSKIVTEPNLWPS